MYLGEYEIDEYLDLVATTHRFSTGAAYDATSITYRVYENGSTTEIITDTAMTKFDSETGFYYDRIQLTSAAGFEVGKSYVVLIKATVDSVAAIDWRSFRIKFPAVDVKRVNGNALGTAASGQFPADVRYMGGSALSTSSAQVGVNVVQVAGTSQTARDLGAQLDASVSSRAPAATALSNATWTDTRAGYLDAAISTRAPASTALDNTVWTNTKAGYLDAAISTRAAESGGNLAAVKAKTDQLTFTTANKVDATIQAAADFAQAAADKVWSSASRTLTALGSSLVAEVWNALTSGMTTTGSIGKLLKDDIDATISSRAAASTALSNSTWTDTRAAYLDAAISSRAPAATALDNTVWTNTKASYLDAAISTRAPASTALSNAVWTDIRAGYLDAAISTRAAASVCTEARLSELDAANLPADVAAIKSDTTAILDDTGTSGVVVASGSKSGYSLAADQTGVTIGTVNALGTQAKADVNNEVVDALTTDTYGEPTSVPGALSSLKDKICWAFALMRNKIMQTATTQSLRNDADSGNIATASVSDDGTTFTRGKWS